MPTWTVVPNDLEDACYKGNLSYLKENASKILASDQHEQFLMFYYALPHLDIIKYFVEELMGKQLLYDNIESFVEVCNKNMHTSTAAYLSSIVL